MRTAEIIARKRDGNELSADEIAYFIRSHVDGEIADYQAAAWLMAIYIRGMTSEETGALTSAMANSGSRLDLKNSLPADTINLDKHSTGGVGDKASLIVVPILAAGGVSVCKMSGRGLGHTGGTLDKLEAIPGFRTTLSPTEMIEQVRNIGACLAGQTSEIAPADKKLYALRDATATVGSLPLIISSILSKKIAGGADHLLFDVKWGNGALMPTFAEAKILAEALVHGGRSAGRKTQAIITDMNQPLGMAIGNTLEVVEAIRLLDPETASQSDNRLYELCLTLAAEGFALANVTNDASAGYALARLLLQNGDALAKFREIVSTQGGNLSYIDVPQKFTAAPILHEVVATDFGYIEHIDTAEIGNIVVELGGGRTRKEDTIDHSVGIILQKQIGQQVGWGEPLAVIHARNEDDAKNAEMHLQACFQITQTKVEPEPIIAAIL